MRHLLDQPRTVEELAALTGTEILEVRHKLDRLLHAGVLMVRADGTQAWSQIRPDLLAPLLEFLSAARLPVNTPPEAEAAAEASLNAGVPE